MAAEYIARHFAKNGLKLLGEDGFQYFEVVRDIELGPGNKLEFNGAQAVVNEDFIPFAFSENARRTGALCFAGYGFDYASDTLNWNDYAGLEIADHWVMILRGTPDPDLPASPFDAQADIRRKVLEARDRSAAGVIMVSGKEFDEADDLVSLYYDKSQAGANLPVIHVKRELANQLLAESGKTIEELEAEMIANRQPASFNLPATITIETEVIQRKATTQNVAALLRGRDPVLRDEVIVIGAHYDHLGMGGPNSGSRVPDTLAVHNGADDNASGVAAILELAEQFAHGGTRPARSLLFLAFGAEEMGLIGSKYFTANPLVEKSRITAMVNFDMVGRMDPETKVLTIGGSGTAAGMEQRLRSLVSTTSIDLLLDPQGYGPSDHAAFYMEDIPVLFFFAGINQDYHTPRDDFEMINLSGERLISEYAYLVISDLASDPASLAFQEAGPKGPPRGGRRGKVTMGIVPDFTSIESRGLRVDGVIPGRPAAVGGMLEGDIIVSLDGKPVKDIYDYMYRMGDLKAGQRVNVDVLRGEKVVILIVEL